MNRIAIELTPDEALVLFEFLRRSNEENALAFADQAEQRVVWNLECLLEGQLPVFDPRYLDLLQRARNATRDETT